MTIYRFITEVETSLLFHYHVDPYTLETNMTILDYQVMVDRLTKKVKEAEEDKQKALSGDKVAKSLVAIRDLLNYISLPKSGTEPTH